MLTCSSCIASRPLAGEELESGRGDQLTSTIHLYSRRWPAEVVENARYHEQTLTLVGKTLEQEETDIGAGSHKILKVMMKAFNIEFAGDVDPELRYLDDPARPYHNAGRRGTLRHFVLRAMITCVKRHAHLHLRL